MKARVLIADDDASVRESLKRVLEDADYDITTVADGQEVLDHLAKERCDVLILDLIMPVCSGWGVLEGLRESHPSLPTVVISALPEVRVAEAGDRRAVFMEKPIEALTLLEVVARLLAPPNPQLPAA